MTIEVQSYRKMDIVVLPPSIELFLFNMSLYNNQITHYEVDIGSTPSVPLN